MLQYFIKQSYTNIYKYILHVLSIKLRYKLYFSFSIPTPGFLHFYYMLGANLGPKIKNCLFAVPLPTHFYPPYRKLFWHFWKKKFAPFSSENQDFPIVQQCKKKYAKKMFSYLPTYPTKKYRVGVQQTNNFLRMTWGYFFIRRSFRDGEMNV